MEANYREAIKDKKRIVVKIGSSSLQHKETGELDYIKMEVLVRELCNLKNQGKDVVLVTSGAIAAGRKAVLSLKNDNSTAAKQACSAIGQAKLITIYDKIFAEYNQVTAQVLMTKYTVMDELSRHNAHNTFLTLLEHGVIPIVNENDTVSTLELGIGDNDTLSAIVASLINADLLILLSDIDGLYTDNPRKNPDAKFIKFVEKLDDDILKMGKKETGTSVGTGGMNTKLTAAKIATMSGMDMIIANADDIRIIHRIMDGRDIGTLFKANYDENFYLKDFVGELGEE